ncbi:uncharacterized protein LOC110106872 [Dendrobium catenatum]|uniref:uncharacterized protein LOC110106872 n=1 Tax=Dendrobium catenatum TaxID=906689 RepID=UPI0009F22FBF|nr:uncharacterized protein LOC110106872 [Dendrobium catenatum]
MDIMVSEMCQVTFSIGKHYVCEVLYDILDMDVCQIILGRPLQFDVGVIYDGRSNSYSFDWKVRRLKLLPYLTEHIGPSSGKPTVMQMVFGSALIHSSHETSTLLVLVIREHSTTKFQNDAPLEVQQLLCRFADIGPTTLPASLPPLIALQHQIDLIPGATIRICGTTG